MKSFLKNLGFEACVLLEIIGVMLILMQYKILSQDIVVLVSSALSGIFIMFGIVTFFRLLLLYREKVDKQSTQTQPIEPSVIIFWALLICSVIMMIITNLLVYFGLNYDSVGVIISMIFWFSCGIVCGIMYLFDVVIIDDVSRQQKEQQFHNGGNGDDE